MKFGVHMLLVMGSICIVFGVRGTSNVEAGGGRKLAKSKISKNTHNITLARCDVSKVCQMAKNKTFGGRGASNIGQRGVKVKIFFFANFGPFPYYQVNELSICCRKVQWLVKTFFRGSKGQTVWPLERLTSKSSSMRYLNNYLSDFYENQYANSNRHGENLYNF